MNEITIYDIATKLKVSASTVSRAINGNKNISEVTRKKVLQTAEEMGYRPNNFAKNLRKNKSNKLIGVIFHKLNSQFSINALYSIESVIRKAGYDIIICHSAESHEQEIINAENLFLRRVNGLIVGLATDVDSLDHFSKYLDNEIPVFLFDRVNTDFPGVKVVLDNFNAGYIATKHLIEQGCKKIVHIAGKQSSTVYIDRLNGYKFALASNNIPFDPKLVLLRGVDAEAVPLLVADMLSMSPLSDGVFAVNDFCAVLCIKALMKAGINIPNDIAFVGFNNDVISTIVEPNLTTINYSGAEIGEIVAKEIILALENEKRSKAAYTIMLNTELVIRDSSKKIELN